MAEQADCVVVGAGIVGLAVARAMARAGREVLVLEAEHSIGTGISSRNSEVIHAGIYYPTGSLKAQFCVAGRQLLYRFCEEAGVEHRRIGKLIVATSEAEVPALARYQAQASANGVDDLYPLSMQAVRQLEPEVRCFGALMSPSTGIVDSHGLMLAYQADLEAHGGIVAFDSPLVGGALNPDGIEVEVGGQSAMRLSARTLINCAGLNAQAVSGVLSDVPPWTIPPRYLAKGHYFSLSGRSPFKRLIYPLANSAGLGTHVTLDLAGNARFGPDVKWVEDIDYGADESRRSEFARAIELYYPGLDPGRLEPSYTGIRPKISAPGLPAADFLLHGARDHKAPYVALYGIESPGLTSSLAIAEYVQERLI